jgi:diguanylate cyclase
MHPLRNKGFARGWAGVKRHAWLAYALAAGLGAVVYLFGPGVVNIGPVYNVLGASAVVAILAGARMSPPGTRLPWYLVATGQALFVAGDVVAYNYQRFFHTELPFPSIADVAYLAVYPALVAGILLLVRKRNPGRDWASLIDSLIFSTGAAMLSWVLLIDPYVHDPTLSLEAKLISIAYPVMDIVVLAVVVRLAVGAGKHGMAFRLVVASLLTITVTDSIYGWMILHGGYQTGGLLDGGWIAFYVLLGAAALHPSMRSMAERAPVQALTLNRWRLALLALATLIAPGVEAVEWALGRTLDVPVVVGSSVVLFSLVVLRMAGLMRHQERAQMLLAHQAFHDSLTGLANRVLFKERVEHALARRRRSGRPLAVLFMDLDDFKTVNDTLGHAAGDSLLDQVARRLEGCVRTADTVARLGGDEFAVLLDDAESETDVTAAAERMMTSLNQPFPLEGNTFVVRASVGITFVDDEFAARSVDELLRDADLAMYTAKGRGKNRYELFEPQMHMSAVERLRMTGELWRAIEHEEFRIHYQPIFSIASGAVAGMEALLRWQHPERGLLAPVEFIELAEDTAAIVPIGRWVLEQACRDARELQLRYPREPPLSVCVNLSARQLERAAFVGEVQETLNASGLPAESLVLELTESVMMTDMNVSIVRLEELKSLGLRLAIDDFGTGFSSLDYVRRLPVDILKVDRSFVADLADGEQSRLVTESIIALADSLGLVTVAEGVENAEQLTRLRGLGSEFGQGFYLGKPVPRDAMEHLLGQAQLSEHDERPVHDPNNDFTAAHTAA